ncbi:DMT family transporter [Paenibacillus cymbidii]|uniref:DMT family transporter n=1 Tax=Paenibacillus cymbidii TaxID=1639034 RepID=UPI0010804C79|nr:multidrug efflux SMR transporter [Paenibacillus cymbidii]
MRNANRLAKGYTALGFAIATELCGTSMLKLSHGFTALWPSIGVVAGFGAAFYSLSVSLRYIPLSLAYAVWSGIGTALTALIGIVVWDDPFHALTLIGIGLIIGGIVLLNGTAKAEP